jgi:NAD(P)-dependent dehydrogenase (short-subunit alcohol dehydrogenase family)
VSARLAGKRAVVTGAASGIGRATALALAEGGAAVVCGEVADEVHETAALIKAAGGRAESLACDVSDEDQVIALFDRCEEAAGGLEIVVANAGISGPIGSVLDLRAADWRRVLDVNLLGTVFCIKHGGARLKAAGGGSIVCTASVAGLRSGAGPSPYSASKAAVVNLVQTSAYQLAGTGVRINAVCPGLVETGMTRPIFDAVRAAGKEHKIGQLNPLQRAGDAAEIAEVIAFLASDAASYINGQAIAIDGGLSASHPFVPGKMW